LAAAEEFFRVKKNPRKRIQGSHSKVYNSAGGGRKSFAYRGYSVRDLGVNGLGITKDGFHIAFASNEYEAKNIIDAVVGPKGNPARVTKKDRKAARKLVLRYGKPRARKVAGGMIGNAKTRKQKEHFVRVRKAINPKKRREIVRKIWTRKSVKEPFMIACRVAGNDPADVLRKTKEVAGKLAQKGWHVRYETS
jgi:hypothetical protein